MQFRVAPHSPMPRVMLLRRGLLAKAVHLGNNPRLSIICSEGTTELANMGLESLFNWGLLNEPLAIPAPDFVPLEPAPAAMADTELDAEMR